MVGARGGGKGVPIEVERWHMRDSCKCMSHNLWWKRKQLDYVVFHVWMLEQYFHIMIYAMQNERLGFWGAIMDVNVN